MPHLRTAFALLLLAWPVSAGAPAPSGPPPTAILLIVSAGHASPVACLRGGRLEPGTSCKGPLRSRQSLRSATGKTLATFVWNATAGICPWGATEEDLARVALGAFSLCAEGGSCFEDESRPKLALWPASSKVRLAPAEALKTVDPSPDLAALAALVKLDPKLVVLDQVFELDLDGDGKQDRVVQLRQPRKKPHPADLGDPIWTLILLNGSPARPLAEAGCTSEGEYLGAVDLDGDGKLELVMLFQYQVILFRLDGSVALENAECCGLG